MKLRNRILIGFIMVILISQLLFALTLYMLNQYQVHKNSPALQEVETLGENETENDSSEEKPYQITLSEPAFRKTPFQLKLMTRDLFLVTTIVLFLASVVTGFWIYSGISVPVNRLREAAKNIQEGNLDFKIEDTGNGEFSELSRDFEEMRLRLKESADEKLLLDKENKELISNISHDLKTPLTAIKGYVEGIMDGVADTPEKIDRYMKTIYSKTNEMDSLINELTFYAKIGTNRIPYNFSRLNVLEYFQDCTDEIGLDLETRGIRLDSDLRVGKDVQVIADGEEIRRVINNIIANAVKYMNKENPRIGIRVHEQGDFIQVEIEDNGKGIDKKELPYIFDRFYRTDLSRNSSTGGSGIGLSIVRKILEDHGGRVWASSTLGVGTTIYFVLRKYQEVIVS